MKVEHFTYKSTYSVHRGCKVIICLFILLPPVDGVMIQITAETMDSLRQALRDMKDFTVTCGKADQEENQELVHIQWTEDDHNFNKG